MLGGLAMVGVSALLRLVGVPLLAELFSDRIIPTLSVGQFIRISGTLGGLERAKEIVYWATFATMVGLGTMGGGMYGLVVPSRAGAMGGAQPRLVRRPRILLAAGLAGLAAAFVAFLWPVLTSNYLGVPAPWSRVLSITGIVVTFLAYGVVLAWVVGRSGRGAPGEDAVRSEETRSWDGRLIPRRTVILGGAGAVLAAVSGGLATLLFQRATVGPAGYDGLQTRGPRIDPVTPNDRFYVVTKNLIDPRVDRSLWRLGVSGLVERPRTWTFDALSALPAVEQEQTLQCISNGIAGGLISNAVWRGVPLPTVLDASGPGTGAGQVVMHAADGYVHTAPLAKAMEPTTILAYEMNGAPLAHRHGFPVRALVPGAFGEVSVKWIDGLELVEGGVEGYYEKQGWMAQFVPTRSRIDSPGTGATISLADRPAVEVRGIAFAGDRGISRVEVSTDGGQSWSPAHLEYAPSRLVWAIWTFPWQPGRPGTYHLVSRATDGTGRPQPSMRRGVVPRGATGYQRVRVQIRP
jgi:DMSO/TMAO reductase YedYZ molybdopterin-dependent catalytic subunit